VNVVRRPSGNVTVTLRPLFASGTRIEKNSPSTSSVSSRCSSMDISMSVIEYVQPGPKSEDGELRVEDSVRREL